MNMRVSNNNKNSEMCVPILIFFFLWIDSDSSYKFSASLRRVKTIFKQIVNGLAFVIHYSVNEKEKNIEQIVIYEEKNNMGNVLKKFRRKLTTHTVIVIDIIWICGRFEYITEETTFKRWVFHTVLNASFLKFKIKFHFYFSDFSFLTQRWLVYNWL